MDIPSSRKLSGRSCTNGKRPDVARQMKPRAIRVHTRVGRRPHDMINLSQSFEQDNGTRTSNQVPSISSEKIIIVILE